MNQPVKDALDRYLNDLKSALRDAPYATRDEAIRDAAEFLNNEILSPHGEHVMTSEEEAYDYCVESYGSPDQVASEYLQALEATPNAGGTSNLWRPLAAALTVAVIVFGIQYFQSSRTQLRMPGLEEAPPKVSPFTEVEFADEKIFVEFEGKRYEWLGIDDIPVTKIVASAKKQFRVLWRKRIVEDLVEVLWGMDHYPETTVKLRLHDVELDKKATIAAAEMTRANRQSMYGNYPVGSIVLKERILSLFRNRAE